MSDDELSDQDLLRYSRHILMPEIGIEGQRRISAARVLMVWPITREIAALSPNYHVEQRLQRDVVRVTRRMY